MGSFSVVTVSVTEPLKYSISGTYVAPATYDEGSLKIYTGLSIGGTTLSDTVDEMSGGNWSDVNDVLEPGNYSGTAKMTWKVNGVSSEISIGYTVAIYAPPAEVTLDAIETLEPLAFSLLGGYTEPYEFDPGTLKIEVLFDTTLVCLGSLDDGTWTASGQYNAGTYSVTVKMSWDEDEVPQAPITATGTIDIYEGGGGGM